MSLIFSRRCSICPTPVLLSSMDGYETCEDFRFCVSHQKLLFPLRFTVTFLMKMLLDFVYFFALRIDFFQLRKLMAWNVSCLEKEKGWPFHTCTVRVTVRKIWRENMAPPNLLFVSTDLDTIRTICTHDIYIYFNNKTIFCFVLWQISEATIAMNISQDFLILYMTYF